MTDTYKYTSRIIKKLQKTNKQAMKNIDAMRKINSFHIFWTNIGDAAYMTMWEQVYIDEWHIANELE